MGARFQSSLSIDFLKDGYFKKPVNGFLIPHVTDCVKVKFTAGADLIQFDSARIRRSVDFTWNSNNTETAYQPQIPKLTYFELSQKEKVALTQYFDLATQSKSFQEGNFNYVFDAQKFNTSTVVDGITSCITQYLECESPYQEKVQAQELHNMLINVGWLESL